MAQWISAPDPSRHRPGGAVTAAGQARDPEHGHKHAREQRKPGEQDRPVLLQEVPPLREDGSCAVSGECERRQDQQHRQQEAHVVDERDRSAGDRGRIPIPRSRRSRRSTGRRWEARPPRSSRPAARSTCLLPMASGISRCARPRRLYQRTPAPTSITTPATTSMMYRAVGCGCGTSASSACPGPSATIAPPANITANTPAVNWITLRRACSPEARYSAGAIVLGFIESARPIDTTTPSSRIMGGDLFEIRAGSHRAVRRMRAKRTRSARASGAVCPMRSRPGRCVPDLCPGAAR